MTLLCLPLAGLAQNKVVVRQHNGAFELVRNGKPYFIRGAGGRTHLPLLAQAGGNSIRTWDARGLEELLDEAHRQGLTVCAGLWLGHERHGFDYSDSEEVLAQLDACLETIRKFKDHPALLLWAIGNEMEGDGSNPAVWYAIDHTARECKRLDPNHPTMTIIAELGSDKLASIERFCPNIDIVGVNTYGGAQSLASRYREAGINKPYILTEFGTHGPWEVAKTSWGAPVEPTSSEKVKSYVNSYREAVDGGKPWCLGAYAFLWGNKQETTATWFGMLLPDGSRLGAVDAMTVAWTGQTPNNSCPSIESFVVHRTDGLTPDQRVEANVVATDREQDRLQYDWTLCRDLPFVGVGGDYQPTLPEISGAIEASGPTATITIPSDGGGYRLFVYVRDGRGGAAVANMPLWVDAPQSPIASPRATLPFDLYSDKRGRLPFAPSGHMGNTQAIRLTLDCQEAPHRGVSCIRAEYQAPDDWGGVLWQSPPNDWEGEMPGGLDLTGASAVEFWVRGESGGEVVSFVVGGERGPNLYGDTAKAELRDLRLSKEWQKQRIPLDGLDLSRIKTGFGWSLAGQGSPVVFFLDDIRYVP